MRTQLFEVDDVLMLAKSRREGFEDWHLLTKLAARVALTLPARSFRALFRRHTRDLLKRGEFGLLYDYLDGLTHAPSDQRIPLEPGDLAGVLKAPMPWVREIAITLLGRLEAPTTGAP